MATFKYLLIAVSFFAVFFPAPASACTVEARVLEVFTTEVEGAQTERTALDIEILDAYGDVELNTCDVHIGDVEGIDLTDPDGDIRDRLERGGLIRLVVTPDGSDASWYFLETIASDDFLSV